MSRWKTNFKNQQIAERIQSSLTTLESVKTEGLSPNDLTEFARLFRILKILAARVTTLDPELYNQALWPNCAQLATNMQSQIATFAQSRNIAHIQQANTYADDILNSLRPLDTEIKPEDAKSISEASAALYQKIVVELNKRADEVKTQLDSLANATTQTKARLDENNKIIETQKTRLDQSIAEFQKQFSTAQDTRGKDFTAETKKYGEEFVKQTNKFETDFKAASENRKTTFDAVVTATAEQSNAHLDFLKKREEEVNKIFGAIGTAALAGNFKNTADREAGAANLLRWIALVLMGAMVGIAVWAFTYSLTHPTDWEVFAFRLGTCIILAIPAFYAANESSKHRERERLNRKVHLELSAIDAYLVLLPEHQRNEIKGKLTEKFFGVAESKHEGENVTKKDLFGMLSTAVNNLTKGK
jgi:hypothetical protein